jgi:photosystem II stability/assembly factor-like uncharacterized protein
MTFFSKILLFFLFLFSFTAHIDAQWTSKSVAYIVADAAPIDNTTTYFVGYQAGINSVLFKTTNGGATLTDVATTTTEALYRGCHFFDAQNGLICGVNTVTNQSIVWRTSDGGATLTPVVIAPSQFPYPTDFSFVDRNVGYLYSASPLSGSAIFKTTNGGAAWQMVSQEESIFITDLTFLTASVGHRLAANVLQITRNGATTWQNIQTPTTPSAYFFQNEQVGYIGSFGGEIWKTTNGGTTWTLTTQMGSSANITSLKFPTPSVGYAISVGNTNSVMRTTDGGTTWKDVLQTANQVTQFVDKLVCLNENRIAAVGFGLAVVTSNAATIAPLPYSTLTISGSDTSCANTIHVRLDMTGTPPWDVTLAESNNAANNTKTYRLNQTPAFVDFVPRLSAPFQSVYPVSIKGVTDSLRGATDGVAWHETPSVGAEFTTQTVPDSFCEKTLIKIPIYLKGCAPWHLKINDNAKDTLISNIMDSVFLYRHSVTSTAYQGRITITEVQSGQNEWQATNSSYSYVTFGHKGDVAFGWVNPEPCLGDSVKINVAISYVPPFTLHITNGIDTIKAGGYEGNFSFQTVARANQVWTVSKATDFCGDLNRPTPLAIKPLRLNKPTNVQAVYSPDGQKINVTWQDNNLARLGYETVINVWNQTVALGVQNKSFNTYEIWQNQLNADSFRTVVTAQIKSEFSVCEQTTTRNIPSVARIVKKAAFNQTPPNTGVAIADMNGDGLPDILSNGGFYINNGSFSFTYRAQDFGGTPSVVGDIDNDGDLDFLVNSPIDNTTKVYVNNGNFTFVRQQTLLGANATFIDYDFNSLLDIAATGKTYKNNGSNNFALIAGLGTYGNMHGKPFYFDLNNDGLVDLIDVYNTPSVSGDSGALVVRMIASQRDTTVWKDKGDIIENTLGTTQNYVFSALPQTVSWGTSYNREEHESLILLSAKYPSSSTTVANPVNVFNYQRAGFDYQSYESFYTHSTDSLPSKAEGVVFDQVNNGEKHIFFINDLITSYDGRRSMPEIDSGFITKGAPAVADFDNDGDLDVVVAARIGGIDIYENKTLFKNNWLKVKLKAQSINKAGLGVKVKIFSSSSWGEVYKNTATIGGLHGGSSRSDIVAHFGLSNTALIDSIQVKWSPTSTTTLYRIQPNQTLLIEEGKDYSCTSIRVAASNNKLVGCNTPLVLSVPVPLPKVAYSWHKRNEFTHADSVVSRSPTFTLTNIEQTGHYFLFAKDSTTGCERIGDDFLAIVSKPKINLTLLDTIDCMGDKGFIQLSGLSNASFEWTFVEKLDTATRTWSEAFQSPVPDNRTGEMDAGTYRAVTQARNDSTCRAVSPIFNIKKQNFIISGVVTLPNGTPSVSSTVTLIFSRLNGDTYELDSVRTNNLGQYSLTAATKGTYRLRVSNNIQTGILTTYYGNTAIYDAATAIDGTNCGTFTANIKFVAATCTTDNIPPVIICPANQSILTLNPTDVCRTITLIKATATDNCGTPALTTTPLETTCFPVGTTVITHTATDLKGNKSTCQSTVQVIKRASQLPLYINISNHIALRNTEVCVTVSADSFMTIGSMQFAIQFNPNVIRFQSIKPNTSTGFSSGYFGLTEVANGQIRVAWNPVPLTNTTFPNGTKLFDICFQTAAVSNVKSSVSINTASNLPIEVTRADANYSLVPLAYQAGSVTIVKNLTDSLIGRQNTDQRSLYQIVLPSPVFGISQGGVAQNMFDKNIKSINIYPNPTNDVLNLSLSGYTQRETKVLIYNSLGSLTKEMVIEQGQSPPLPIVSGSAISIFVRNWQEGTYFMRLLQDGEEIGVRKFVIVK